MDKSGILKDTKLATVGNTDLFIRENEPYNRIYKATVLKTERLVSAIHLVTGLMDTKETLRWELRSVALESMSEVGVSDKILKKIFHILSLLEVGLIGGLISQMNYSILKEEYSKLRDTLLEFNLTDNLGSLVLQQQFLGTDIQTIRDEIKREQALRDIHYKKTKDTPRMTFRNMEKDSGVVGIEPKNIGRSARQGAILKHIKDGAEYTIRDIITMVANTNSAVDCSDKTVQRDLLSMVSTGILVKRGERRWSRYSKKMI